jgi:hypothetical protein
MPIARYLGSMALGKVRNHWGFQIEIFREVYLLEIENRASREKQE